MQRSKLLSLPVLIFSLALILAIIPGCGRSSKNGRDDQSGTGQIISIAVSPAEVTLAPGATQKFEASVSATGSISTDVTWSVITPNGGIIDQTGLYTAPSVPGEYYVKATSVADPSKSAQAKVIVAPVTSYAGTITIRNTGNNGELTINEEASLSVTIPAVPGELGKFRTTQVYVITASINDSSSALTFAGSISSTNLSVSITLTMKDTGYDLDIGNVWIPVWLDGFGDANAPVYGRNITNCPKPSNPSRLQGNITAPMNDYSFANQVITWDLEANF